MRFFIGSNTGYLLMTLFSSSAVIRTMPETCPHFLHFVIDPRISTYSCFVVQETSLLLAKDIPNKVFFCLVICYISLYAFMNKTPLPASSNSCWDAGQLGLALIVLSIKDKFNRIKTICIIFRQTSMITKAILSKPAAEGSTCHSLTNTIIFSAHDFLSHISWPSTSKFRSRADRIMTNILVFFINICNPTGGIRSGSTPVIEINYLLQYNIYIYIYIILYISAWTIIPKFLNCHLFLNLVFGEN